MNIVFDGISSQAQEVANWLAANGHRLFSAFHETCDLVLLELTETTDTRRRLEHWHSLTQVRRIPLVVLAGEEASRHGLQCLQQGTVDEVLPLPLDEALFAARLAFWQRYLPQCRQAAHYEACVARYRQHLREEQAVLMKVLARFEDSSIPSSLVSLVKHHAMPFHGNICLAMPNPAGGLTILLGDFPGHGVAAALAVLPVAEAFRSMTAKGYGIAEMLPELNAKLEPLMPKGEGFSACLVQLEADCHSLQMWNGGMPDVLIQSPDGGSPRRLAARSQRLGEVAFAELDAVPERIEILPGSRLVLHSRGMAGLSLDEPLATMLTSQRDASVIVQQIEGAVAARGVEELDDDVCLLLLHCDPEQLARLGHEGEAAQARAVKQQASRWDMSLTLGYDSLRKSGPVPVLMQLVMELQGLEDHREALFTILSELFNNALDHGILGLDSSLKQDAEGFVRYYQQREQALNSLAEGEIRLDLSHQPAVDGGKLEIRIRDSGRGFDVAALQQAGEEKRTYCGRGLGLVRALCQELEFLGCGNDVRAVYQWHYS